MDDRLLLDDSFEILFKSSSRSHEVEPWLLKLNSSPNESTVKTHLCFLKLGTQPLLSYDAGDDEMCLLDARDLHLFENPVERPCFREGQLESSLLNLRSEELASGEAISNFLRRKVRVGKSC